MKKVIKWNGYAIAEGLLVSAFASSFFATNQISKWLGIAGCLIGGAQAAFGLAKLTNKTSRPIYCKDENSDEVRVCNPMSEIYDIDGFIFDGKVYKINDGVHATITESGVSFDSILFSIRNKIKTPILDESPGAGWGEIFKYVK